MMLTWLTSARPARDSPPEAPGPKVAVLEQPKLNERMSIALLKLVLGPSMPLMMQYAFTAISCLLVANLGTAKNRTTGPVQQDHPAGSYFAAAGRSATNRNETVNSSNWKCGRRKATAR